MVSVKGNRSGWSLDDIFKNERVHLYKYTEDKDFNL